jgi:hypothetical protein
MHWTKGGEVIVRIPTGDGKVMELYGDVQDISLEMQKDIQPIYSIGHSEPANIQAPTRTVFTIRGIAREQHVVDPPKEKVVKPSRWSDIMDEDF